MSRSVIVKTASKQQGDLFGYINPLDGTPALHPPLCACGACNIPVERFPTEQSKPQEPEAKQ